jgi:hypothetical protein
MTIEADLRQFHHEGSLSLFVGAGVSIDCGLPDWMGLSKMVIEKAWPNQTKGIDFNQLMARIDISSLNPLDSMRMARRKLKDSLNSVVSDCLYCKGVTASAIVDSIVSLRHIRRICCFNYDDVLEEAYQKKGVAVQSLTGEHETPDERNVLIFHPHGFLPRGTEVPDRAIILSEDDYHELYASPYSWRIWFSLLFFRLGMFCSLPAR